MKTKVSILSAVIAAVVSASAVADIKPLAGDQFTVGGTASVGGYHYDRSDSFYSDATNLELGVKYNNGPLVGYLELDIKAQYGKAQDGSDVADDIETDVDKAWFGYDFGYGVVSYGVENDTALDKVDGAGDMTYEFGQNAADTSDAFDVIKVEGKVNNFAYGVSYFEIEDESDVVNKDTNEQTKVGDKRGYNGYVGYTGEMFTVYAGYEERGNNDFTGDQKGDKETVATIAGSVDLGVVKLGANVWTQDLHNGDATDKVETVDGYYVSAAKTFGQLTVAAGYGDEDGDVKNSAADNFDGKYNVSAFYQMSENTYVGVDVANSTFANKGDETDFFVKAGYTF